MFFCTFPYEMNIPEAMNNTESDRVSGQGINVFGRQAQWIIFINVMLLNLLFKDKQ